MSASTPTSLDTSRALPLLSLPPFSVGCTLVSSSSTMSIGDSGGGSGLLFVGALLPMSLLLLPPPLVLLVLLLLLGVPIERTIPFPWEVSTGAPTRSVDSLKPILRAGIDSDIDCFDVSLSIATALVLLPATVSSQAATAQLLFLPRRPPSIARSNNAAQVEWKP